MINSKGFTLMEVTVAMAVLIAVIGIVLIGTRGNSNDYRALRNAAVQLQADMRYAQRRATIEGRNVYVSFDMVYNRYTISVRGTRLSYITVREVYLRNGITIFQTNYPDNRLHYLPRGTVSRAGTIALRNGRYQQDVTVTVSGGRVALLRIIPKDEALPLPVGHPYMRED